MGNKNQQYAELYAEYAMEQMRLFGIPASVTLAQGILESANGQSLLAKRENNHFGIKASRSWLDNGGRYGLYTDDRPDEKFCSYDSVADSYSHHSQFLKNNSRYSECFKLSADDYKGWAEGLDKAGYATAGSYAPSLISIIERNNLQRYDLMVIEQIKAEDSVLSHDVSEEVCNYSFPIRREEFMLVTSPFGMRNDPVAPGQRQMHKGIDIRCNNEPLMATENNGRIVATNDNANTPGGKSVTVEYQRSDGTKRQVYYAHLSNINVSVGDTVNAGTVVGISGNTGSRTTGPHLHFGIKNISTDGSVRDIDPAAYLAEIAQKGNISQMLMYNGTDILAKYRCDRTDDIVTENKIETSMSPEDWMKKLLTSEDSSVGLGGFGQDPIINMVITLFTSLMALAVKIDNKSEEESMPSATTAVIDRTIDLASLVPNLRECRMTIGEDTTPVLHFNDGSGLRSCSMRISDVTRLNNVLNDSNLSEMSKREKVVSVLNKVLLNDQISRNYIQGISEQSVSDSLSR